MADTESKALQAREKTEITTPAEQTKPGPIFTPAVDIFETEKELTLLADMPGVKANCLSIDRTTINLFAAIQLWPALIIRAVTAVLAQVLISASSRTI